MSEILQLLYSPIFNKTKYNFYNYILSKYIENACYRETLKLSSIKYEIKTTLDNLQKNPIYKMTKEEIREQNEKVFGK